MEEGRPEEEPVGGDVEEVVLEQEEEEEEHEQHEEVSFPKSLLKRLVKEQMEADALTKGVDVQVNKDSVLAFDEAAKLFIHYLTCAANDLCIEAKRQTLGVEDVFQALEDSDFGDFVEPLRASLAAFKESKKKRKSLDDGDAQKKTAKVDGDEVQE